MSNTTQRRKRGSSSPHAFTVSNPNTHIQDHDDSHKETLVVKPFIQENFIEALYKPHTVTILLILITSIIYFSFIKDDVSQSTEATTKRGLVAVIVVFLVYCGVQFRDGIIIRPHPAVWRVVTGVGLIYLLVLVFFCFQSRDDARRYLAHLYPELGKPLPERSYGDSCDIYTPNHPESNFANLRDTLLDEFIIAHVFGYVAKAIIFRDMKLCWLLSLFFEIMEITLQHWLENFKECWWDHLIIDVLVCNNLGIVFGLYLCDFLRLKKYPLWIGVDEIPTTRGKVVRILQQFTPFSWTSYNWRMFENPRRFAYSIGIVLAMNIVDLNAFFLKYILWVPPRNPLNTYRLLLWFFVGMPAVREYYQFASDDHCKRLGNNIWLAIAIVCMELLLVFKYSTGLFHQSFPNHIWFPWLISGVFFVLWFVGFFYVADKNTRENNRWWRWVLNALLTMCVVPLVVMFFLACPDIRWMQTEFDSGVDAMLCRFGRC
ncbi:phosphatidylserine synthase [Acrasis kona]|uniref:Phosphatidylserine synthase n=1 Tax=Acrasis kona TaxID=1008807 RepID=A0AAW2YJK8_9EUKA